LTGNVSVYYLANKNLDSLILNLSDSLQVDSILQNQNKLTFLHQNNLLRIDIEDISVNLIDSLSIYYQGKPSPNNNAFFIAVQDSINKVPILSSLSEPYGSSDWWPCKNTLTDKIDSIDVSIDCPVGNIGVSVGLLKKTQTSDQRITYYWQHRYPITPYLVSISVSRYTEYHSYIHYGDTDSILFQNYLYPIDLDSKKWAIDRTSLFFNIYDSLFIEYPFCNEKYGHVEFPIRGGMEHQTISSMGIFNFEIISHELAHQWFGDYITCNSWEDLWLNEGFATYCTGLCYENTSPQKWWPIWKEKSIDKITQSDSGRVFPSDTNDVAALFDSRLTYHKASYLLHMIRWTIGDEDFFQAIRNYLNDRSLSFNFAKTPNLISHFEQEAATSLSEFMNDWFYGEGYPIFNIKWQQNNHINLTINIEEHSVLEDQHFFKLFVPLRLIGENDTLNLKLNLQENHQEFNFCLNFKVDSIVFDPDFYLISKNASVINESIPNFDILLYPNPCKNKLTIESPHKIIDVQVIDNKGCILNLSYQNNSLDLSLLPSGIYYIRIQTNNNLFLKKIIKN
jgi:aminopeptidase N